MIYICYVEEKVLKIIKMISSFYYLGNLFSRMSSKTETEKYSGVFETFLIAKLMNSYRRNLNK